MVSPLRSRPSATARSGLLQYVERSISRVAHPAQRSFAKAVRRLGASSPHRRRVEHSERRLESPQSGILSHADEKDITSAYDRYGYDAEKKAAMEFWNRQLVAILRGRLPPSGRFRMSSSAQQDRSRTRCHKCRSTS